MRETRTANYVRVRWFELDIVIKLGIVQRALAGRACFRVCAHVCDNVSQIYYRSGLSAGVCVCVCVPERICVSCVCTVCDIVALCVFLRDFETSVDSL